MRPIFCGNFEYDARQSDLERLFRRYGKVDRVDMKSGFAFVYMEDERDADDAIRALDRIEFGRKGRRLRVEWTKQERSSRRPESTRKSSSNLRPSKTLFVINFDPYHTRARDLERHFDPYGKILNIRIRRNFAFIQFESQEDASKALDATNMTKLLDRIITVEYAIKDDDERQNGNSPDRVRDRSPRRGYDRARSQSPYRRERESPDYGHSRGRSPSPYRRERASPDYARGSSGSPNRKERGSPNRRGRGSPYRKARGSPNRKERGSPNRRGRGSPDRSERDLRRDHELRRSPSQSPRKERETDQNRKLSTSPRTKRSNGDVNGVSPVKRASPEYGHRSSPSPEREEGEKVDNHGSSPSPEREEGEKVDNHGSSPSPELEEGEKVANPDDYARERSPAYSDAESPPPDRYGSQSPVARERS